MDDRNFNKGNRIPYTNGSHYVHEYKDEPLYLSFGGQVLKIIKNGEDGVYANVDYLVVNPDNPKEEYKGLWEGEPVEIGRDADDSKRLSLTDYVSRNHANITRYGNVFLIVDNGSLNGSYILHKNDHTAEANNPNIENKEPQPGFYGGSVASEKHPDRNEDNYFIDTSSLTAGVFDGLGGYPGSEVASAVASQTIQDCFKKEPLDLPTELAMLVMEDALYKAHKAINDQDIPKIATTATAVRLCRNLEDKISAVIGNVGDSRAYLMRGGKLGFITFDDSFLARDLSEIHKLQETLSDVENISNLSEDERSLFKERNYIHQCLGNSKDNPPTIAITSINLYRGDKLLLTTDGIHDNLTTLEIENYLNSTNNTGKDNSRIIGTIIKAAQKRSKEPHDRAKLDDMTALIIEI